MGAQSRGVRWGICPFTLEKLIEQLISRFAIEKLRRFQFLFNNY
jgi:hypothetical protein